MKYYKKFDALRKNGYVLLKGKSNKHSYSLFIDGSDDEKNLLFPKLIIHFSKHKPKHNLYILYNKNILDFDTIGIIINNNLIPNAFYANAGVIGIGQAYYTFKNFNQNVYDDLYNYLTCYKDNNISIISTTQHMIIKFFNYDLLENFNIKLIKQIILLNNKYNSCFDAICDDVILPFKNDFLIESIVKEQLLLKPFIDYLQPINFYNPNKRNFVISLAYNTIDELIENCIKYINVATEDKYGTT